MINVSALLNIANNAPEIWDFGRYSDNILPIMVIMVLEYEVRAFDPLDVILNTTACSH